MLGQQKEVLLYTLPGFPLPQSQFRLCEEQG